MPKLPLAGSTFAWVHRESLEAALEQLGQAGLETVELMTVTPHVGAIHQSQERKRIRTLVERAGLPVLSVNPTFIDINLVSAEPLFREVSIRRMRSEIELAAELGASLAVIMPGRRHALSPAPQEQCLDWFREALDVLIADSERHDITLCIENSPYGYMGRSQDILAIVTEYGSQRLRVVYDVANALAVEDPREGVQRLRDHIALTHVSDTWRDRWAHTSPGRGEVDFAAFADALGEIGFTGFSVYELVDGEAVGERLDPDLAAFVKAGWSLSGHARR